MMHVWQLGLGTLGYSAVRTAAGKRSPNCRTLHSTASTLPNIQAECRQKQGASRFRISPQLKFPAILLAGCCHKSGPIQQGSPEGPRKEFAAASGAESDLCGAQGHSGKRSPLYRFSRHARALWTKHRIHSLGLSCSFLAGDMCQSHRTVRHARSRP